MINQHEKIKLELLHTLGLMHDALNRYRQSKYYKPDFMNERLHHLDVIHGYYREVEKIILLQTEVIKKQALIMDAAGIQYPTINQSLGQIQDIWLATKGRHHEIGHTTNLTVEIHVV